MIAVTHPAVNAYTRNLTLALAEADLLEVFHTTLAFDSSQLQNIPGRFRGLVSRRSVEHRVWKKTRLHPCLELARLSFAATPFACAALQHETGPFCVDAVYHSLDRSVAKWINRGSSNAGSICAGEDAALLTFQSAKQAGMRTIYELPIGHHVVAQTIFQEEAERWPRFAGTLPGLRDSPQKLDRKKSEIALADIILACSPFVAETCRVAGVPDSKIRVVSYGCPAHIEPKTWTREDADSPLKVLFVGAIGQRKGIADLLEALRLLNRNDVELTLMGTFSGNAEEVLADFKSYFCYEPPRANDEVLELMKRFHVLVIPSLFEGLALVILEAMACGIPVIVTPNTGAGGVVRDNVDGFVIPIRSPEILAERLNWMADHRSALPEMGESAAEQAKANSWVRYREQLVARLEHS